MHKLILFLLVIASTNSNAQPCPPKGDNIHENIQAADILKNRNHCAAKSKAKRIKWSDLSRDKVTNTGLVYIDAYITSAKISGVESCECHINKNTFKDYHIYISNKAKNTAKNLNQIVEVSRYSRKLNPGLSYESIHALVGHKVRIYGYTFMDTEHKGAIGDWRMGIQEIHPVFFIDTLD